MLHCIHQLSINRRYADEQNLPLMNDQNAFADNQTGASALDIILLHQVRRVRVGSTVPGQGRHGDAVLERHIADLDGGEECFGNRGHGESEIE